MFSKFKKLELKLPQGVPPAVAKSFSALIPMFFTLSIIAILNVIVWAPVNFLTTWDVFSVTNINIFQNDLDGIFTKATSDATLPTAVHNLLQGMLTAHNNNTLNQFILDNSNNPNFSLALNALLFHGNDITVGANHINNTIASFSSTAHLLTIKYEQTLVPINSFGLGSGIYRLVQSPFLGFISSSAGIGVALLFVFLIGLFWFFGIHGANIVAGIFEPLWWAVLGINAALVQSVGLEAARPEMIAFSKPFFDSYMAIGGAGATLALIISTLIISKKKELKEVAKFSLPAGIFQINEPVMFGYPIILNPLWIVPFITVPIINVAIAWLCVSVFHIVSASYIATPWTAPWFLGALLSTGLDWRAFVLSLVCFAISMAIWFPTVLLDNKLYKRKLAKQNQEAILKVEKQINTI